MMKSNLLLVGSIPLESAEDVFNTFGRPLGPHLGAMPDGEVGLRRHWISRVHYQVLALHPDLEVVSRPALENGAERLNPRNAGDAWRFKVRDGVRRIRFGEPGWRLGYARDAVNSYFIFRTLREQKKLPDALRFQVSLPSVSSAIPSRIFGSRGDMEIVRDGYEEALRLELQTIIDRIPGRDLAVQWDCATEVHEAYDAPAASGSDAGIERNLGQFERLCALVPTDALLGYHLCFGTLGGWPRFAPVDLGRTVALANALITASGRRVDWLHIPILDRTDDAFFAPLAGLQPGGTRIFLGLVHNMERFDARVAAARKFLPDFGMAAFCGFGRISPADMPRVLEEHLKAAEAAGR